MKTDETGFLVSEQKGKAGFLEELYLSGFDTGRFDAMVLSGEDPRAAGIIDEYGALIKGYPPEKIEREGSIPRELMAGLKRVGLFGLNVPAVYGGVGLSIPGYLKVLEVVARTDMSLALIPTAHLSIGLKGIVLFGTEEQKKRYLPRAATGDMIFAYALTEPDTGSDAQHIETRAELSEDGSHYILNGRKSYITNANYAGGLTVFAQLDPERPGQMGAFVVETAWEGVTVGRDVPKMGLRISSTATIGFKDVKVPVENLLGRPGDGFRIAMTVLNYGRLGLGAASVGVMKQSLEDMLKRSAAREQFGGPIGEFPLVQEKMVRARVHAWVAGCMTAMTSLILGEDPLTNAAMESSHTKLYGTTRAWNTLYDALQVAGGSGYLSTQPYEKRMRDFRVTTVFEGTTEIHSVYPALFQKDGAPGAASLRAPLGGEGVSSEKDHAPEPEHLRDHQLSRLSGVRGAAERREEGRRTCDAQVLSGGDERDATAGGGILRSREGKNTSYYMERSREPVTANQGAYG
jgi:acyl-CoA dehydrogenase family protein 9